MTYFNNNKYGWIKEDTIFCRFSDHHYIACKHGFMNAHHAMSSGNWVRFGTYRNEFEEVVLAVEGSKEAFEIREDAILNLAYALGAVTTDWKEK